MRAIATIPTNFRFSILRRGSGHALDCRLSEQEFQKSFSNILCICSSSILNLKSAIENLKCHLMTRSALTSTLGGIVRPICLAVFQIDDELELRWLFHRKVGRFGAFRILST